MKQGYKQRSMGRALAFLLLFIALAGTLWGQSAANYSFTTVTDGSLENMSSGTTEIFATGTYRDDNASTVFDIGFPYVFMGQVYTQFSINSNGQLKLGSTVIGGGSQSPTAGVPLLGPISGDNAIRATGKAHYKVTGSAPNRVLVVEWTDVRIPYSSSVETGTYCNFQALLHEASGKVEYRYGTMHNMDVATVARAVFFAVGTTAGSIGQLTDITAALNYNTSGTSLTNTTFSASSAMTNLHSAADGSRRVFNFEPGVAATTPTDLTFTSVGLTTMTLNWVDSPNEIRYAIFRSTDGTNYTLINGSVAAGTTTFAATGLNPGTTYYWRVYALSEGKLGTPLAGTQATPSPTISGVRTIGATGDYPTLTAAVTGIQTNGLAGATTLEFLADYAGGETFPITFTNLTTTSSNTLTVRPATGVSGINVTGSNTTAIIRIQNEDYVIFDGRPGGSGSNRELTFTNSGNGPTILLIDDASNNTIRYCNVVGSANTSSTSGVILFSTTANTTGNDNNTIDNSDINALGSAVGICASGTTGKENDNNTISNNRIRNFYISSSSTTSTYGIRMTTASNNFTVTGNSLYQEAARTYSATAVIHYGISASNTTSVNGFLISGNFIGGSAPSCGGSAFTHSSGGQSRFFAIELNVGTTNATSVQGNTIQNFDISSAFVTNGSTLFGGMVISAGQVNIGNVTGNTIGSATANSITVSLTGATVGAITTGIAFTGGTPHQVLNNTIAGITVNATTATAYGNLYAISLGSASAVITVTGNTIGAAAAPINNNSGSGLIALANQYVTAGIRATSGSGTTGLTITNNTIQYLNMPAGATNAGATLYGLQLTNAGTVYTVTGNTITNLSTGSARTSTGTSAALMGINHQGTTAPTTINGNTVHSLSSTDVSAAVSVYGIYLGGPTSGTNTITKNNVHSLSVVSTAATADLRGIVLASGLVAVTNNMVRLGINAAGSALTTGIQIIGIIDQTSSSGSSIDHNSVYIGGTGVGTQTGNSYAFRSNPTFNTRLYRNNIFVNERSNATTGGKHYAVMVSGTGVNPTGLTLNYNIYRATGTGAVFGFYGADQATFSAWQIATGQDANSAVADPNFISSTGNSGTVNLHLQSPTPAEATGILIATVTEDFDGQTRADFTPVDIGADAGNFTGVDAFPPVITYVALTNTASTGNRTLASVTITDQTGVPTVGILQPRIWFRRSSDPASTWASVQGTLQSGSAVNGVWNFVIDYSALSIVPVIGETYQYYLAVQDAAGIPNVTTSPLGGVHVDVNTQTSPPGTPSQYNIVAGFAGAYTVPGSYPTLTASGGLFAAINAGVLTGNVTVSITADITTEDGQNALNQWANDGGTWNLTIQPDGTTERVISGNVSNGMIRFNGADRVTIDGRSGGSGRYLRFKNLSTAHPTFTLINDASNNTITNCFIEGSSTQTTNGVIFFTTGTTTGNDNNSVTNCVIRDRSDATAVPANLIYSAGSSATITNTGNTISGNEMFNFTARGIQTTSTGNENWTISSNEIYQTASRTTALYGIDFNSLGTNLITLNTVRALNTTGEVRGFNIADARGTTVSRNKVSMTDVNGGTNPWAGIYYTGSSGNPANATLVNNQITLIPQTNTSMAIRGIYDYAFTGNTLNAYYNTIYIAGTATGSATWALVRGTSTPTTTTVRNNLFFNNRTGGTVNHFALGDQSNGSGTFNVSNNLYVGTGITAANFMDRGTNSAGTAESFSAWRTAKSDLASYGSVAADITAANLFTAPTTGDLNILTDNTESWNVNGKGIALVGFADDFGATGVRSVTPGAASDIGSDEFTPGGAAVNAPAATASGLPAASTTTTYTVTGNQVGSIVWGAGGTVPTSLTFRYYSGTQAPSAAARDRAYLYYDISQSGGSGFTYDLILSYDENQLNGIAEGDLRPAKSNDGGNTWTPYLTVGTGPGQYQINTTANTITIYGLTDFSLFTLTSQANPLPVQLSTFNVTTESRNALLSWETATEENAFKFVVERKNTESATWSETGEVKASGNSNSPKKYNYTDQKLNSGKYNYRLKMIDNDGTFTYSDVVEVGISVPKDYAVSQNYPNPFNPATRIDYQLPFDSRVQIELYNITGERVATLVNMDQKAGYYTFDFTNTSHLSSGVYIYRIIATGAAQDKPFTAVKKMVMMK